MISDAQFRGLQNQVDQLTQSLQGFSSANHQHLGTDSLQIIYANIAQRKLWLQSTIYGADAATAANYSTFWIAPVPCYVSGFREVHAVKGTDGGTVTITLEKLTGTTAPGAGIVLLTSALSLKGNINTVVSGTVIPTIPSINLNIGDRLALLHAGTLTAVANVTTLTEITLI